MTDTSEKSEKTPIVISTRAPTDDSVEEPEPDEKPKSTSIPTSTRVP